MTENYGKNTKKSNCANSRKQIFKGYGLGKGLKTPIPNQNTTARLLYQLFISPSYIAIWKFTMVNLHSICACFSWLYYAFTLVYHALALQCLPMLCHAFTMLYYTLLCLYFGKLWVVHLYHTVPVVFTVREHMCQQGLSVFHAKVLLSQDCPFADLAYKQTIMNVCEVHSLWKKKGCLEQLQTYFLMRAPGSSCGSYLSQTSRLTSRVWICGAGGAHFLWGMASVPGRWACSQAAPPTACEPLPPGSERLTGWRERPHPGPPAPLCACNLTQLGTPACQGRCSAGGWQR